MENENWINKITEGYQIYVVGQNPTKKVNDVPLLDQFDLEIVYIDSLHTKNAEFTDLLNQLDGLAYGNKNLAMPKWVSLDCAMVPGAFIGLAKNVEDLPDKIKNKFDISSDYDGLVPLTEYCAIPTGNAGVQEYSSHTLASLIEGEGLGLTTKLLGLKLLNADKIIGAAQYDNYSLKIHTKISDLHLLSVLTPAHSEPDNTFVYEAVVDQEKIDKLLSFGGIKQIWVNNGYEHLFNMDSQDYLKKKEMQENIENNLKEYKIIFPGYVKKGDSNLVTLVEEGDIETICTRYPYSLDW